MEPSDFAQLLGANSLTWIPEHSAPDAVVNRLGFILQTFLEGNERDSECHLGTWDARDGTQDSMLFESWTLDPSGKKCFLNVLFGLLSVMCRSWLPVPVFTCRGELSNW